jgi:hypothetical protein
MPAYYDEAEAFAAGQGRSRGRLYAVLGTLALLAAAGGGAWTVMGGGDDDAVPVLHAGDDPVRTRPDAPGGKRARYSEVTSFRVIDGDAPDAPEVATFAAGPAGPAEEDMPMGQIAAVTTLPTAPRPPASMAPQSTGGFAARPTAPGAPRPSAGAFGGERLAALHTDDALLNAPAGLDRPRVHRLIPSEMDLLENVRPQRQRIVSHQAEPNPPRGEGSVVAPPVSPVARARPALIGAAEAEPGDALAVAAERSPVQIQLGAFPELDIIQSEWKRVSEANRDVLGDRALAVQKTSAGGMTYYRLRVGPFADGQEASTVCQALKTRGYDCLVAINTESRG